MNDAVSQKPSVAKTVARVFSAAFVETRHDVGDLTNLPDRWLIARVRRDPVNVHAFDALIDRHWKPLFAHCQMLTVNSEEASDLARAAWRRVLRSRRTLDPTGDLLAHLVATATDLWRKETQSLQPA